MQFPNSSPSFWSHSRLPLPAGRTRPRGLPGTGAARKLDCGWYDSSMDLAQGLEITEEDNDALYQLWQLSLA